MSSNWKSNPSILLLNSPAHVFLFSTQFLYTIVTECCCCHFGFVRNQIASIIFYFCLNLKNISCYCSAFWPTNYIDIYFYSSFRNKLDNVFFLSVLLAFIVIYNNRKRVRIYLGGWTRWIALKFWSENISGCLRIVYAWKLGKYLKFGKCAFTHK